MREAVLAVAGHVKFFRPKINWGKEFNEVIHLFAVRYRWSYDQVLSLPAREIDWFLERINKDLQYERELREKLENGGK